MAAAGAAAALTARLPEESLSEGRASVRTHCCRTRAAMTEKSDCKLRACNTKKKRVKSSAVRMRTTQAVSLL